MSEPVLEPPRVWQVVEIVRRDLTEEEARSLMQQIEATGNNAYYAVDSAGTIIETYNGPLTIGRPHTEVKRVA